jgi:hypothetical protein
VRLLDRGEAAEHLSKLGIGLALGQRPIDGSAIDLALEVGAIAPLRIRVIHIRASACFGDDFRVDRQLEFLGLDVNLGMLVMAGHPDQKGAHRHAWPIPMRQLDERIVQMGQIGGPKATYEKWARGSAQARPGLSPSSLGKVTRPDSGQLRISAKPDQSQQYAEIDFQIDAYISGSRRPPHCPLSPPRPKQEIPMKMAIMTMMVLAVGVAGCAGSGNGGATGAAPERYMGERANVNGT